MSAAILGNPGSAQDSHILSWLPVGLVKPTDTPLPTSTLHSNHYPISNPFSNGYSTPTPVPTDTANPPALHCLPPLADEHASPTDDQPAAAQQSRAGGKKLIVVSISQQHVYAYQGGTLVYSFVASTGSGNSTRTGTFSILDKIPKAYG